MTQQHPINPPLELVRQWVDKYIETKPRCTAPEFVATRAAQWGAEQMWEACRSEIIDGSGKDYIALMQRRLHLVDDLGRALRPKPKSEKQQALEAFDRIEYAPSEAEDFAIIRHALEQLPDEQ
jgi:hypothetical protein